MKIHSKFHDYYDVIQRNYPDDPDHWTRTQKEFEGKDTHELEDESPYNNNRLRWSTFIVHFCGKSYLGVKASWLPKLYIGDTLTEYCYTVEQLEDFVKKTDAQHIESFNSKPKRRNRWRLNRMDAFNKEEFERIRLEVLKFDPMPLHTQHEAPIILEQSSRWSMNKFTVNPQLKTIDFERKFDPYLAFQEIDQFLSSRLSKKQKEMVNISDEDMAAKKGFFKWSFRKEPTKKK